VLEVNPRASRTVPFISKVIGVLGNEINRRGYGIDTTFGTAYLKSRIAAGRRLPKNGSVFISVKNQDKRDIVFISKKLADLGFDLMATSGTADVLMRNDLEVRVLPKLHEGRPNIIDFIKDDKVHLIINTPSGKATKVDETKIRSQAVLYNIPLITTIAGAQATVNGIENLIRKSGDFVKSLQEYHQEVR
jgi:carbamoyl-phosphate synthase large subunit